VDALARAVLTCPSWLAPGTRIPRRLLKLCVRVTQNDTTENRAFADAVTRLLELALVERAGDEGALAVHRPGETLGTVPAKTAGTESAGLCSPSR
jgi:hypothetical protein